MSDKLKLNTEIDSLKNNVIELRNENYELNSIIVNTKSQINTLELALSNEMSKANDLSNVIKQQKNDYVNELHELNETLVCYILYLNILTSCIKYY